MEETYHENEAPDPLGWNLIGLLDHKGGIGNAARTNIEALSQIVGTSRKISFPSARWQAQDAGKVPAIHGRNYLHFNPCTCPAKHLRDQEWFAKGQNIGFWAWETTEAPAYWRNYQKHLRQIWVPSEFVRQALLGTGFTIPIKVIPHAITPQPQHAFPAAGEPLTFMVQFDPHSRLARKRPDLSLKAIQQAAMRSGEKIKIIIKTHRGADLEFTSYRNIEVELIDEWLSDAQMDALWRKVDILVSLNRGEGFGLPLVEAMARGIPVVATWWGATKEYMKVANSCPVNVEKLEACSESGDDYFKTGEWALPDAERATVEIMWAMENIRSGMWERFGMPAARAEANRFSLEAMRQRMKAAIEDLC